MVEAEQMQETMQRERSKLGRFRVSPYNGLMAGDAARNHDVSEERRAMRAFEITNGESSIRVRGKTENVCRAVAAPITPV